MHVNEIDTLIRLLDAAITSDNETVKQQLQSLLVTVSLVHSDDNFHGGPFSSMARRMDKLESTVMQINDHIQRDMVERHRQENRNSFKHEIQDYPIWRRTVIENDQLRDEIQKMNDSFKSNGWK